MNDIERRRERAVEIYRRLVAFWYPAAFRDRVGKSTVELFADRYRDAAMRGRMAVVSLWIRTFLNVLVHGPLERLTLWREARPFRSTFAELVRAPRALRRAWRGNLLAVSCIALGIAGTSAVLTLFSAVVVRPAPFPDADRLVRIWSAEEGPQAGGRGALSTPDVTDIRERLTTLDRFVATVRARVMFMREAGGARRVEGEAIPDGYFELLDVEPMIGRPFSREEYEAGSEPVMILAYSTWLREFGADPSVVGSDVRTALRTYTVIGIMPPDFVGTIEEDFPDIEFWIPLVHDRTPAFHAERRNNAAWTIGRLAPGVTLEQAAAEVTGIGEYLSRTYPAVRGPRGLRLEPFGENWRESLRERNYLLLVAAALLLVVAAANVAGLLLVQSFRRRREVAVRAALGASRARLLQQSLAESLVLTIVGGAMGVTVAPWILSGFLRLNAQAVPIYVDIGFDAWAAGAAAAAIGLTALAAGAVPALAGSRVSPGHVLRGGGRGTTTDRLERSGGSWMVGVEVMLTTVLVVTAGLLVRTYHELGQTDLGFTTDGILRIAIFADERDVGSTDALPQFYDRIAETLSAEPGVKSIGLASPTVPPAYANNVRLYSPNLPDDAREFGVQVQRHRVDDNFFGTLDIPILAGRAIDNRDTPESAPVVVVSESVALLLGGAERAIGRTIELEEGRFRIAGVSGDVLFHGPVQRRERDLDVYISLDQRPSRIVSIAMRTTGDPAALINPMRRRLNALAPSSALDWINPLSAEVGIAFHGRRFYLVLVTAFATSALALTAVGVFAVLSYQVSRRRSEFGLRQALGARRGRMIGDVVRHGLGISAAGIAVGCAGALLVSRWLAATVHGVERWDPIAFGGTAVVIVLVAGIATYVPAARAARVDPMDALRDS